MSAAERKSCLSCKHRKQCAFSYSDSRINASPFYPAFYRNRQRYESPVYKAMKRLRGIWAEGAFSFLKREHNLARAKKRGLHRVHEECPLSALALSFKAYGEGTRACLKNKTGIKKVNRVNLIHDKTT